MSPVTLSEAESSVSVPWPPGVMSSPPRVRDEADHWEPGAMLTVPLPSEKRPRQAGPVVREVLFSMVSVALPCGPNSAVLSVTS